MASVQKRIVYLNHTGQVSGAERVLVNMVKRLDRKRFDPYVLCPEEGELRQLVTAEGVPCAPTPAVNARFTWRIDKLFKMAVSLTKAIFEIRRRLDWLNPDLVHANTLRAGIVASLAAVGTGRIVIWHVHDILPQHPISAAIRFLAWFSRRTQIIAVSQATATAFSGRLSFRGRIRVIHNGTDLNAFPCKEPGSTYLKKKLGIPEDAFLICAVGQICARKGLLELLKAFERIHGAVPQMHLAIAGKVVFVHEEKYFQSLLRAVGAPDISERVHFLGEIRDVSPLMQAADLLVLNSREEPFGLVLIEAMSSGTPVLATRVGGIPEIVKDSENGWLIEKSDTAGLSRKMLELSQRKDLLDRAAQYARRETCPQFSLDRFQSRLQMFYAEIAARNKSAIGREQTISTCH
jgi:glycosyltransferase involved in cell wall biosynthesis